MGIQRTRPGRTSRAGYTLMELLVVIAILAVLAALGGAAIFGVFGSAQSKTDRANWLNARIEGMTLKRTTPINVLFIGNSYTEVNDLPQLIADLAQAAGSAPALTFDTQLVPAATLQIHWQQGTVLSKIQKGGWDFVVLQEQSQLPYLDPNTMSIYARLFCAEIRAVGAIPLFFLTWSHLSPPMQQSITNSYVRLTTEQHAEVSPVGMAWQSSLKQNPALTLHAADGSHPNPTGSYLAACVFYASIFDKSPQGLPAAGVDPASAVFLQGIAWQTVQQVKKQLVPDWKPAA